MLHQSTFHFVDTEEQAKNFVEQRRKQRRKAWYTPWSSADGKESKFIVWYYLH